MIGKLKNYCVEGNIVTLFYDHTTSYVKIVKHDIINFYLNKFKSYAIEKKLPSKEKFTINFNHELNQVIITTKSLKVIIKDEFKTEIYKDNFLISRDYAESRKPLKRNAISIEDLNSQVEDISIKEGHAKKETLNHHKIEIIKETFSDEYFYGLGEKTGFFNKKYYEYENWNTDDPTTHTEFFKSLYKSIPFFIVKRKKGVYGIFFDNTARTFYDFCKESDKYFYFGADEGAYDYYFIYGDTLKDVIKNYAYLTGFTPLPQRKALGYHQSRWSYGTKNTAKQIIDKYKEYDIPLDFLHLDIDYMDNYKVFTFDNNRFSNIDEFINENNKEGLDIITIIDPGVKVEKDYFMYEEAIKNKLVATKDNEVYINQVWPGDSVYPDFTNPLTRKWWAEKTKILTDKKIFGIWNDMNEPASFKGPLPNDVEFKEGQHSLIHNVYGHLMSKATYEGIKNNTNKRPFVITRACFAGSQKYTTFWTGDNQSLWVHLQMAVPMLINMGLSGLSFVGTDVGGFGSDTTKELLLRWYQVGCFSPLFRNHSSMLTRSQEPFAFDLECIRISKKFIELRYMLIPYFYDLFYAHQSNALPILRPILLNYEDCENALEINDQFMIGDQILVSPILEQGKTQRVTYLPKDFWYDVKNSKIIKGDKNIISSANIDECPIYLKKGTILPLYPVMKNLKNLPETLNILIIPGNNTYNHYIDDGESFDYKKNIYSLVKLKSTKNSITSNIIVNNYKIPYKDINIYIYSKSNLENIYLNNELYNAKKIKDFALIKTKSLNFKITF